MEIQYLKNSFLCRSVPASDAVDDDSEVMVPLSPPAGAADASLFVDSEEMATDSDWSMSDECHSGDGTVVADRSATDRSMSDECHSANVAVIVDHSLTLVGSEETATTTDGSMSDECHSGNVAVVACQRLGTDSDVVTDVECQWTSAGSTLSKDEGDGSQKDGSGSGCCGRLRARCRRRFEDFSGTKYYDGASYLFGVCVAFVLPFWAIFNWYFDIMIFQDLWSWNEGDGCLSFLHYQWPDSKLEELLFHGEGEDGNYDKLQIFLDACETLSKTSNRRCAVAYIGILILSLRHQTLFYIIRQPSFPLFDQFSAWAPSRTAIFYVPFVGSMYQSWKTLQNKNDFDKDDFDKEKRESCCKNKASVVIENGLFLELVAWISIPFMMARKVLWIWRVWKNHVSGDDNKKDYIINANEAIRKRKEERGMQKLLAERSHEEGTWRQEEELYKEESPPPKKHGTRFSQSKMNKNANPIYFTGFTYTKFLKYASMWTSLMEDFPQLLVLLVVAGLHRYQDDYALKEAFIATHVESNSGDPDVESESTVQDNITGEGPNGPYWVPDFSRPFSEGTCEEVVGAEHENVTHYWDELSCCEASFEGQGSSVCLAKAVLGRETFWVADFSVPYSEGLCAQVGYPDYLHRPHFQSWPRCCEASFQDNARTKCLERAEAQRGIIEDLSNAEWFFWIRMATSFLSILYSLYQWKYTNIHKEMEKARLSEKADKNKQEYRPSGLVPRSSRGWLISGRRWSI